MSKASTTKAAPPDAKPAEMEKQHPLRAIRRAGVPLAAFETADPALTLKSCMAAMNGKIGEIAVLRWDVVRAQVGLNDKGKRLASGINSEPELNPVEFLNKLAAREEEKVLCFVLGGHRLINEAGFVQGLWNLRDSFKAKGSTLVLLCPSIRLPDDLTHDVVVVGEPLPNAKEVEAIVEATAKDAGVHESDDLKDGEKKQKIVDTLLGMSGFAVEQCFAMSVRREGIDRSELWERKRKMVEQTPGLSIWRGGETFADIGGLDNLKDYLSSLLKSGKNPVRAIGFIDEIEKMFAGSTGDLSGVSQDQLRVFLTAMQDESIPGLILIGPPGTGKSAIAKGAGSEADAEVLAIDTGAMTGSLVGQSQAMIRKAMQTFTAVSQGKGLFIATCNSITSLPPELRRRFTLGTFYIDLPMEKERTAIWPLWMKKFGHAPNSARPDDKDWTGAEVKACCEVAYRTGKSLVDAARFIVPVAKSAAAQIEALRKMASERFISASVPGLYKYDPVPAATAGNRRFDSQS